MNIRVDLGLAKRFRNSIPVWLISLASFSASAATFYVDSQNTGSNPDGTLSNPWPSINYILNNRLISAPSKIGGSVAGSGPIVCGDTIVVAAGSDLDGTTIDAVSCSRPLTFVGRGKASRAPMVRGLLLRGSRGIVFDNFQFVGTGGQYYEFIVSIANHNWLGISTENTIKNSYIWSEVFDKNIASGDARSIKSGISSADPSNQLLNNTVSKVSFGISGSGNLRGNKISEFTHDAFRAFSESVVSDNFVRKPVGGVPYNLNHPDMFQSWSVGEDGRVGTGAVSGVVLRRNIFVNDVDPLGPSSGVDSYLQVQGVGLFDGFYDNWLISDNIVAITHVHGISALGIKDSRVTNNYVVEVKREGWNPNVSKASVNILPHKDGRPSTGNIETGNVQGLSVDVFELQRAAQSASRARSDKLRYSNFVDFVKGL